jgi:glycosyltransferase involved in cell wall biosynthesis
VSDSIKVSVIIPTYNRSKYLPRAVKSVLGQTFSDLEVIIVDDCSTDQTPAVAKKIVSQDSRVRYHRLEKNQGAPKARNTGIGLAKGEYIGLLDDDDNWRPNKLELQVKKFDSSPEEVALVYGGYKINYSDEDIADRVKKPKKKGKIFEDLLDKCRIGSPTVLVRAVAFDKVGRFDLKLKSCQDWDMWLRISKEFKVDYVDEVVADYYLRSGGQISRNFSSQVQGRKRIFKKYRKYLEKHPDIMAKHIKTIVRFLVADNQKREALDWHKKLMNLESISLRNLKVYLAIVFFFGWYQKRCQRV